MLTASASARTIILTAEDCDQMAFLSAKAPRLSWAGMQGAAKVYTTENQVHLFDNGAILMRFGLEQIPKGQRITKAELTIPADYVAGKPALGVRRILAEWGTGVCHEYRRTFPKKVEWTQAGCRGAATDRAAKDTAVFRMEKVGDHTVDVTEDIELWYTNAAPNRGWALIVEPASGVVYLGSPYSPHHGGGKRWKLQITYEPQ